MHPSLQDWKARGTYTSYKAHSIFYVQEGKGVPVLALHGYPLSSWDWSLIWDPLTAHYQMIAPDFLGFGFSDKPPRHSYSVFDHADLLEALLASLGISEIHLLAHDLGNSVAQELLARVESKQSLLSLSSICFLNGGLFSEVYRPRLIQKILSSPLGGLIGPSIPRSLFKKAIGEVFGPAHKPSEEQIEIYWQIANFNRGLRVTHRVGRFIQERIRYRDRWVQPMEKTKVPMRFINGPFDPNSGMHMVERYRELVPHPDVVVLEDSVGHWPQLEEPEKTAEEILKFFRRVSSKK